MKTILMGILALTASALAQEHGFVPSSEPLLHVSHQFTFTIHAPMRAAAPLFGAHAERAWAGAEWDPQFIYPQPAADKEGMVFTVCHPHTNAIWVNTVFDLKNGHVQYVYFIPDALVTRIDIHITASNASTTNVKVVYERTALSPEANAHVRKMGEADAKAGPEWEKQITEYFKRTPG
ncbi:MAG: hypothetical protein JWO13_1880 [Acidobacteriales bacterium]|nr:hypothetical protein [Terriglobales bacterium]